jgi:deoxyribodipyrimidine photo-lyase
LHFGHIAAHEVLSAVMTSERWTTRRLSPRGGGAREVWWGVSDPGNTFLDQLVVWRELAFNECEWIPGYMDYQSLPSWARGTLEAHGSDPRRHCAFETLESAATQDPIWNAAQRQLLTEGWFHVQLHLNHRQARLVRKTQPAGVRGSGLRPAAPSSRVRAKEHHD